MKEQKMRSLLRNIGEKPLRFLYRKVKTFNESLRYGKFKANHIFHISVDDVKFKMSFADYKLQGSIVERIEGKREKGTVSIIKSIVHEGAKILELGGCYGYFTMIMSKCAGDTGKVVSIEGTPNNYRILCNNLRINDINNVDTYNVFLTTKSEFATFTPDDKNPYGAIKRLESSSEDATEKIKTAELASFLRKIDYQPDNIFMDIEGFEVEVFENLSDSYFNQNRPVIVFETHQTFYEERKGLDHIKNILEMNQYIYRMIGENLICFPRIAKA